MEHWCWFRLAVSELVGAVYRYLTTHLINIHITSRVFMLVLVLVVVIVFFVLPVYSVIVTNEDSQATSSGKSADTSQGGSRARQ